MTIQKFNDLSPEERQRALTKCCGSMTWVMKMLAVFPIENKETLLKMASEKWQECEEKDFLEAFSHHPKIGDIDSLKKKFATTAQWASGEQSGATHASQAILEALAKGNEAYENKFGYIFIVCATGKSAEEMLEILQKRLPNKPENEIKIAAAEQNKITQLRLEKLLT